MELRATYHSQGLSRALAALRVIGDSERPLSLADLSRAMDLPKSTLIRLLSILQDEGFVRRIGDPPAYVIGHAVHALAESYRPPGIAEASAQVMQRLAAELGFTTNLGVLEGRSVLHVHVEEPARALRFATGGSLDFTFCTALGKMLLSTLPLELVGAHIPESEPYPSFTPKTLSTRAALDADLERIRETGVSLDDEERNRGVTCMAVLVPAPTPPKISLSVSAPSGELTPADQAEFLPVLRRAAADLAASDTFLNALEHLSTRSSTA